MMTLDEIIASSIRGYVAGELGGYSYHGDGSAIEAMKRLDGEANGVAAYARAHRDFAAAVAAEQQTSNGE